MNYQGGRLNATLVSLKGAKVRGSFVISKSKHTSFS